MYTQQQQQLPLEAHTQLPSSNVQVIDDVSGPLYHQRQVPEYYVNTTTTMPVNNSTGYAHHENQPLLPAEPTPSSTDIYTTPLNINQLAEFVSTMIYLLWHVRRSSVMELHSASTQGGLATPSVDHGDTTSIMNGANSAFQRFCHQILTATQLSESVVMLSLKYIAKLLQTNPRIQGAEGSEYRLFIVALLLANKFQDDNTYTNKTWSAISGMKVQELNIMELEFLDVLDFRLFVQKEEFSTWKTGLLTFMAQLQNATLMQEQHNQQQIIDSTLRNMGLNLPATPDPTWNSPTNNILAQQQQQQYLYLLSTAQPQFPTQPLNAPLTRVPLRIPTYPVYMSTSTTSTPCTTTTTAAAISSLSSSSMAPSLSSTPSLAFPAPVRTTNRTIPRNASTPSLASLANSGNSYYQQNNSTMASAQINDQHHAYHHPQSYRPYEQPGIHDDDQQSWVDYYAWKSLTEGKMDNTMNIGQQLPIERRSSRARAYSNPSPSFFYQQKSKPYSDQKQQPHDMIYQGYQQQYQHTDADPSYRDHGFFHQQTQQAYLPPSLYQ
ncbi:cyclin-domain-containing protein [Halteromyces radiatus]|uniref:cyclin-domain-containing protein n=1 Tax=Halteromyces radiatus TaxID=101107 RepID=UPI00221FC36E|nr:cyclin-domain-containing protein [Halteromyces radiatus]KAI8089771.1 cyclin-domain-containing protein [Halteromyces radiatus]